VRRKQAGLTQFSDQRVAVYGDNATAESACGAYVEADIGIDQRLLCCGDAIDDQRGVEWRIPLDQPQRNGPELEVTGRAAYKAHSTPVKQQFSISRRQRVDAAIQVEANQPTGRPSEVVHPGDGLLTPVAALVQMDCDTEQADLIRDGAVVGVEADPWHTGSDPMCLESPGAGSWTAVNDIPELIARHEELAATKRIRADSDEVVAGQLRSRPHDSTFGTPVAYLNSHQETHAVQPAHKC
jgi:hypothetical protein